MSNAKIKAALHSLIAVILMVAFSTAGAIAEAPKPLWKAGKYYGLTLVDNKWFQSGITFRISPDKITLKDLNIEFEADFHDELGNVSKRSIHFSQSNIDVLTLTRTGATQTYYFAYLDESGYNWNTEVKIAWSRPKQSFKVTVNALTDEVEGTYYKASSVVAKKIVRR